MKIKLTDEQIELISNRLKDNLNEEADLRIKDERSEPISGWDFVHLSNERGELEYIVKNGYIEI